MQSTDRPNGHPFLLPLRRVGQRHGASAPLAWALAPPHTSTAFGKEAPVSRSRTNPTEREKETSRERTSERTIERPRRLRPSPYGGGALRFRMLLAIERRKGTGAMLAVVGEERENDQ
ncbi:UNVERIFIED_CONTAM: DNA repair Rad4 domain protein, putative [Hammondia hammondi]|eukprot:XP_008888184.1 DNA repair Rad4 domain protein, putative [Hammondia hammondi]